MNIKLELIAKVTADYINSRLQEFDFDADEIADTTAICALSEIQKVIQDEQISDFDAIEKIVVIFEKYHINAGVRHDFS